VNRASTAAGATARVTTGRSQLIEPLVPVTGNQESRTAKMLISINANQKLGMHTPARDPTRNR